MVYLTENVLVQIVIVIGGILTAIISSGVGYVIWNKKDKKRREEKEEDYRRELKKEAQEREERQNQDSKEQTKIIMKRLDKMENKIDNLYQYQSMNAEAISLIFESDMIQFDAFRRSGLLNGESEKQEAKLKAFLQRNLKSDITPNLED